MALLDASIPTPATLGDKLASIHRDTRAAVNSLAMTALLGTLPRMTNEDMDVGANYIDVLGNISFNIKMVGGPNDLVTLPNGFDGQFIILRLDEGETVQLTVKHNILIIYLQELLDFKMYAGDVLILLNKGGVIGGNPGVWYEIHRQLYKAILGLIDGNGKRYKLVVDNYSALNVELL